jgi:signal transduction histidine kinase
MIGEERLLLSIQDDGIGYGRDITHGKGLANMKVRARKIGGILSITSAKGTLVMLGLQLSGQAPEK